MRGAQRRPAPWRGYACARHTVLITSVLLLLRALLTIDGIARRAEPAQQRPARRRPAAHLAAEEPRAQTHAVDAPPRNSSSCVESHLLTVLAWNVHGGLPPKRSSEALVTVLRDADPDVIAFHDGVESGADVASVRSAMARALPGHVPLADADVRLWWRASSLTARAGRAPHAEVLAAVLRPRSPEGCPAASEVELFAGGVRAPLDALPPPAGPRLVVSGVSADVSASTWAQQLSSARLADVFELLGEASPPSTSPSKLGTAPPYRASAIALGDHRSLVPCAATALRRFLGPNADEPADHFPILAALRLAGTPETRTETPRDGAPPTGAATGAAIGAGGAPLRFTSMTINVWGANHLGRRKEAIGALFTRHVPDVLALQVPP